MMPPSGLQVGQEALVALASHVLAVPCFAGRLVHASRPVRRSGRPGPASARPHPGRNRNASPPSRVGTLRAGSIAARSLWRPSWRPPFGAAGWCTTPTRWWTTPTPPPCAAKARLRRGPRGHFCVMAGLSVSCRRDNLSSVRWRTRVTGQVGGWWAGLVALHLKPAASDCGSLAVIGLVSYLL